MPHQKRRAEDDVNASAAPPLSRSRLAARCCAKNCRSHVKRVQRSDEENLIQLLYAAAEHHGERGLVTYPAVDADSATTTSYRELLALVERNGNLLKSLPRFAPGTHVLLHLEDATDTLIWFWSIIWSGAIPTVLPPLSVDAEERAQHLMHLSKVLDPVVITEERFLHLFDRGPLELFLVEEIERRSPERWHYNATSSSKTALVMLTSGSTGNAKAVPLSHDQIFAAVRGKAAVRNVPGSGPYLNWIGLDHVASLVEIHILALFLGISQIHAKPCDVISKPLNLLELCSKHKVARTFAPNSFLRRLSQELCSDPAKNLKLDLSSLYFVASGGEANSVETGVGLSAQLSQFGAPPNVITPGFGMTETCAGSIFNTNFPEDDRASSCEYASLGNCMPGIEMRIEPNALQESAEIIGELQLRGKVVFKGYLNDTQATADAFTKDGWFKTGDQAFINTDGRLKLIGRTKDTLVINGLKYQSMDLELAVEKAEIQGVTPSFIVCFAYRVEDMSTEGICLAYLPSYSIDDSGTRARVEQEITSTIMLRTGCHPYVLPLSRETLQKTSIGKFSRQKLRCALENGGFKTEESINAKALESHRQTSVAVPVTDLEHQLLTIVTESLGIKLNGVDCSFFEAGVTSIDLIRLKSSIETSILAPELSFATIISNPTVRSLAKAMGDYERPQIYNPVVPLQTQGSKTPLWLIHPGVGEVLIFLSLASKVRDRPVYALRARGFNGEDYFSTIEDAVWTYYRALKERQPRGPYAIAGYSYGSMLAFELTKVIEDSGEEVRFLGCLNLPPHIKSRMKQLDWIYGLLHLSYFLNLITEQHVQDVAPRLRQGTRAAAIEHVAEVADPNRLEELKLSIDALVRWANLSYSLQSMAQWYDPSGSVRSMDVFVATPLKAVSADRKDWREKHLSCWTNFVDDVKFHDVRGSHYTMLAPEHVTDFWETMKIALNARGV